MTYMLDTNICIYLMNGNQTVTDRFYKGKYDVVISSVVYAELVYGVEKSNINNIGKNRRKLNDFLKLIGVLPFDRYAANIYGKIRADLEHKGTPIGDHDMMIAAHALSLDLPVVTNNVREFERVPGLKIENWAE